MQKNNKGQISALALWAMGIVSTAFLGYAGWTATAVNSLRGETREVQAARVEDLQRISVTETKVSTVENDVKEIKGDVKLILQKLK